MLASQRRARVFGHSLGIEHFGKVYRYGLPLATFHVFKARHACEVLPHVVYEAVSYAGHFLCRERDVVLYFQAHVALYLGRGRGRGKDGHLFPCGVVEAGFFPAVHFALCVVDYPVVKAVYVERAAVVYFPRIVGYERLVRAVGVFHLYHGQGRWLVAVLVAPHRAGPAEVVAEPAVSQLNAQGVVALAQHLGHVVGVVHYAVAEVGPARVEVAVAHALPVDVEPVSAARRGVKAGAFHGFRYVDALAHYGGVDVGGRHPEHGLVVAFGVVCLGVAV